MCAWKLKDAKTCEEYRCVVRDNRENREDAMDRSKWRKLIKDVQ